MDFRKDDSTNWYLDSGASKHVTCDLSNMFWLKTVANSNVHSTGGQSHSVTEKWNVLFKCDGEVKKISNVLYVPGVTKNSVGSITDQGCIVTFGLTHCHIVSFLDPTKVIARSTPDSANGLSRLESNSEDTNIYSVDEDNSIDILHCRLGHVNLRTLHEMAERVQGLSTLQLETNPCRFCVEGKHRKTNIPRIYESRASRRKEIIHSGLCGPMQSSSLLGLRYFITFTNNYSRKTWTYFLEAKSETLQSFKTIKQW